MPQNKSVTIIAAIGKDTRALGKNNKLIWDIPDDLERFRSITKDTTVIMGRKTLDSIGRALPHRINIVVTRNTDFMYEGVHVTHSLTDALIQAEKFQRDVYIIGGAEIYTAALPFTDQLLLTCIDSDAAGDTFFPDYSDFTKETFREEHDYQGLRYTYLTLER